MIYEVLEQVPTFKGGGFYYVIRWSLVSDPTSWVKFLNGLSYVRLARKSCANFFPSSSRVIVIRRSDVIYFILQIKRERNECDFSLSINRIVICRVFTVPPLNNQPAGQPAVLSVRNRLSSIVVGRWIIGVASRPR